MHTIKTNPHPSLGFTYLNPNFIGKKEKEKEKENSNRVHGEGGQRGRNCGSIELR
jgi:hypothetical protein